MACGEYGEGKMSEPETIVKCINIHFKKLDNNELLSTQQCKLSTDSEYIKVRLHDFRLWIPGKILCLLSSFSKFVIKNFY